jgi:cyclohexanecarboxylate-CoA ligase
MSDPSFFDADHFRTQGWWRNETLSDWLERRTLEASEQLAVVTPTQSISYSGLSDRVSKFAAALQRLGIGFGDIVAVHLPNIPEFLISWLAINSLGAVMQTVHMPYGPREVETLLRHSGAKACIALSKFRDKSPADTIAKLRSTIPTLQFVISVGDELPAIDNFDSLLASAEAADLEKPKVEAGDAFLLLYTSGTTSAPKAVMVSYNNFLSNARLCAAEFGIQTSDRIICLAPFTHLYGLYALQLGFSAGATACLLDLFAPPAFIDALKRFLPTVLFGGPAHISPCMQQNLFEDVDLSGMRIAVLSGSTVPPSLSAAFQQRLANGKVLQAWGMTELQFGACSRPGDPSAIRFETIGRATPGTELRVADAHGRPMTLGEVGELHVRGCSLFSGYVRNEEATKASFLGDGWFRTGDLASMDEQGNVRLSGRTKELINRGGIKFNPIDMEIALSAHPAISQVAIAPIPDAIMGERACCFVTLRDKAALTLDDLRSYLLEKGFAKFTWPESLAIVLEMPFTPTRKIMKGELVKQLLETK